jgi:uncharacterized protein with PIN domain
MNAQPMMICDAMLGRLARWLRAAGHDAAWQADIADWDLIRRARREGRILLSCDTGIFRIGIIRDGDVPALQVPNGLSTREQFLFVFDRLHLTPQPPRCMACGGELRQIAREEAAGHVPERSFQWLDEFWQCGRCGKVFWPGTHWQKIRQELQSFVAQSNNEG